MTFSQYLSSPSAGLALLVAVALALAGCDSSGPNGDDDMTQPSIAELVNSRDDLSTLGDALEAAGLAGTFTVDDEEDGDDDNDEETQYTVFAPTNAAFEPLAVQALTQDRTDLLAEVLQYHVVDQAVLSSDLEDGQTIETLQGDELTVSIEGGTVSIGGAEVVEADIEGSNGVVHVIDGVLLGNRTVPERLSVTSATTTASAAIDAAGLTETLSGEGPFTVFAPTNPALNRLTVNSLVNNPSLLSSVLQYHVVSTEALAQDLSDGQTLQTVQGDELTVSIENGTVSINGAQVVVADLQASNGVIHQIDAALLENRTAYERLSVTTATQELTAAIDRVGLTSTLNDENATFTVFAPTDDNIPDDLSGFSDEELENILLYHVLGGAAVASGDIMDGQTATTEEGSDVQFTVGEDTIRVNDAPVTRPNLGVNNGVVHQIGGLLMPPMNQADVTITVENVGTSAYEVTDVSGASGVASTGTENPSFSLTVGTRYRIDNDGGIDSHPFAFQNSNDEYLLRQESDQSGSLEGNADINYQEDDEGVTFTYTQEFADAVNNYRCTVHGTMEGSVQMSN